MKLKMKNYVAPEAFLTRVCTESGICGWSKGPIVEKDNTEVSIDKQGGQDWTTEFSWD